MTKVRRPAGRLSSSAVGYSKRVGILTVTVKILTVSDSLEEPSLVGRVIHHRDAEYAELGRRLSRAKAQSTPSSEIENKGQGGAFASLATLRLCSGHA